MQLAIGAIFFVRDIFTDPGKRVVMPVFSCFLIHRCSIQFIFWFLFEGDSSLSVVIGVGVIGSCDGHAFEFRRFHTTVVHARGFFVGGIETETIAGGTNRTPSTLAFAFDTISTGRKRATGFVSFGFVATDGGERFKVNGKKATDEQ